MIAKAHIIAEIARTAKANGGLPLGRQRFYAETGMKETDWLGKYWARWGDAIREAGLTPRTLQVPYGQQHLLEQLASFARELGRFPGRTDIQLKARRDKGFPHPTTFRRLGHKRELAAKLAQFCESRTGYDDVLGFCTPVARLVSAETDAGSASGRKMRSGTCIS